MSKITKKRNWACVVYPDSAPSDWHDILKQKGLKCAISPLHDSDVNADESEKKPHWHVIMCWDGPTTYSVACEITSQLKAPNPMPLESIKGYYRYLTHMDNPEKKQYNQSDIIHLNGFDISDYIEITRSEILAIKRELIKIILENNFLEYSCLINYLYNNNMSIEFDIASSNTIFFNNYMQSLRHHYTKY